MKKYVAPMIEVRRTELKADYAQFYSYHEGCATPQVKENPSLMEEEELMKNEEWGNLW